MRVYYKFESETRLYMCFFSNLFLKLSNHIYNYLTPLFYFYFSLFQSFRFCLFLKLSNHIHNYLTPLFYFSLFQSFSFSFLFVFNLILPSTFAVWIAVKIVFEICFKIFFLVFSFCLSLFFFFLYKYSNFQLNQKKKKSSKDKFLDGIVLGGHISFIYLSPRSQGFTFIQISCYLPLNLILWPSHAFGTF